MELPSFLTNKQDVFTTLGAGLCIGAGCKVNPLEGAIAAVAARVLHHYFGWGATIGACLAYGEAEEKNLRRAYSEKKTSPLPVAVIFGAIGYGVERIARRVFFS